jgi:4'-phosphopantetheinyl transferase EntD
VIDISNQMLEHSAFDMKASPRRGPIPWPARVTGSISRRQRQAIAQFSGDASVDFATARILENSAISSRESDGGVRFVAPLTIVS